MDPTPPPLIYLDTSVISHLEQEDAPDKMADTLRFWDQVKAGRYAIALSDVTLAELEQNTEPKRGKLLGHLQGLKYSRITLTEEISALANMLVEHHVLTETNLNDRLHIACSIIGTCDIVSNHRQSRWLER
jgi:predicted nucleic acid-binding protein